MKNRISASLSALTLAFAVLVPLAARGATFVVPSDAAMIRRADAIVIATAVGSGSQRSLSGEIETVTELTVHEVLKGDVSAGRIQVHEPGGTLGDTSTVVFGAPTFEKGRRVLLMLSRTPLGTWAVTDLVLGKFGYGRDTSGVEILVREETEVVGWDVHGNPHIERRRNAAAFVEYIRTQIAGRKHPVDYNVQTADLIPQDESLTGTSSAVITDPAPATFATNGLEAVSTASAGSYMMTCGAAGCRWAVFPNAVAWYNQNTEPGAPNGGLTAIQTSFANWNNECGSNINYTYAGSNPTAVRGLAAPDGVNAVQFEGSLAQYGVGPYVCGSGGTIAMGGVTSASGSHSHPNGEVFVTTREADVVVNVGLANCTSFLNSGDFISAMEHEFGHTLGFRHSNQAPDGGACPAGYDCSSRAIMNSVIVSGLNGVLQQWDINAAQTVYPGGSCTTPPPPSPSSGVKGDFDGNGRPDILLRNYTTGQNAVWLMTGVTYTGTRDLPALSNTAFRIEGTADFNADGRSDIVLRNYTTGQNALWLMMGTTLSSIVDLPALPNTNMHIEGTGDFNRDGKPDLLLRNYSTGQNAIWLMNGTVLAGIVDLPALTNTFYRFESTGDFNSDGSVDIVLRNYSTGQNALWLMSGVNFSAIADLPALPNTNYRIDGVADFTGEGRPDIVWREYATGRNSIWVMNGTSLASIQDLPALPNTAYEINGPR